MNNYRLTIGFYATNNMALFETRQDAEKVQNEINEKKERIHSYRNDTENMYTFEATNGRFSVDLRQVLSTIIEDLEVLRKANIEAWVEEAKMKKQVKERLESEGLTDFIVTKSELVKHATEKTQNMLNNTENPAI